MIVARQETLHQESSDMPLMVLPNGWNSSDTPHMSVLQ